MLAFLGVIAAIYGGSADVSILGGDADVSGAQRGVLNKLKTLQKLMKDKNKVPFWAPAIR